MEEPLLGGCSNAMDDDALNNNDDTNSQQRHVNINNNNHLDGVVDHTETTTANNIRGSPSDQNEVVYWYQNPHQLAAMISNFSTSYNVVNISLVIPILQHLHGATTEDLATSASSLLAGMVVGQLLGGFLGDSFLGRLGALRLVMILQVIASIGSACIPTHGSVDAFLLLAFWRFVLGIGAGGVYPLAAVLSAEQNSAKNCQRGNEEADESPPIQSESTSSESESDVHNVVLTFSTQGLGFVTVPIVGFIILQLTSNLHFLWRFLLAFGCLPGIVLLYLQWRVYAQTTTTAGTINNNHHEVPLEETSSDNPSPTTPSTIQQEQQVEVPENGTTTDDTFGDEADGQELHIVTSHVVSGGIWYEPSLVSKLLRTAGTWFLFDVLFYGNTLFQPVVVETAFGATESSDPLVRLKDTVWQSLLLTSIALPGYAIAGLVIGKRICCISQTPRYVMLQGFASMAVLYFTIGANWSYLRHFPAALIILYGLTFFFANYGPNTTTFILPSLTFSPEYRSTLNGICAASGKVGALVGATLFQPAVEAWGDSSVMLICGGTAILAFLLTFFFTPKNRDQHIIIPVSSNEV